MKSFASVTDKNNIFHNTVNKSLTASTSRPIVFKTSGTRRKENERVVS